jgi:ubiquinone biosynthesis protein
MGRIDKQTRIFLAEMIQGFLTRDYLKVAKVHFEAGFVPKSKSLENFAQACRSIGEPIIGQPVNNISIARLLEQLFKITKDFEMETQPQLLLLQKTMVLIEGIGMKLDPDVNMWKLAEPWIENWAIHNISPEAKIRDGIVNTFSAIKNKLLHNDDKEVRIVERIIAPQKSYLQVIVISSITTVITYMILKFVLN